MKSWILALAALFTGCVSTKPPRGTELVQGFQPERYLGTWYEIARLDHRFERGLTHVSATYSKRDDGGLKVANRGYDPEGKEWKLAIGKAYFTQGPEVGQLKVSFFGPFYGAYNVIALDQENYRYALVCGPDTSYLWILAREPQLDPAIQKQLLDQARDAGFPVDELVFPDQTRPMPKDP